MPHLLHLENMRFGRLKVLRFHGRIAKHSLWEAVCDCGERIIVRSNNLRTGHTISCGCFARERNSIVHKTSGESKTRFYSVYRNIRNRCQNENVPAYKHYGGRGIKCLWPTYESFRDEMYKSYLSAKRKMNEKNISIERVDVNGHYCKQNCKWIEKCFQARNKRSSRLLTFNGRTMILVDWAKELNLGHSSLIERLNKWPLGRALTEPKHLRPS